MMDQRSKFAQMGISTEFVAEHSDPDSMKGVLNGQVQLVYISPESIIANAKYRSMLLSPIYKKNPMAIVVDEAHCIKTWYVQLSTYSIPIEALCHHAYLRTCTIAKLQLHHMHADAVYSTGVMNSESV